MSDDRSTDDVGRALFVQLFKVHFVRRSTYHLNTLLELLLGARHLIMLIVEQGHTPQMIDHAFPTADQLRAAFDGMQTNIVNAALGYATAQFRSSSSDEERTRLLNDLIHSDAVGRQAGPFAALDHTPLFLQIEAEITNGRLSDDPAWHEDFRSRRQKKKKVDWRTYMEQLLHDLHQRFTDTMGGGGGGGGAIDCQMMAKRAIDGILANTTSTERLMSVLLAERTPVTLRPTHGPTKVTEAVGPHQRDEDADAQRLGAYIREQLQQPL